MAADHAVRDQAVQTAVSFAQDELTQLRATISTLRETLENQSLSQEQALSSARSQDRIEIEQLQETVRELRDLLQAKMQNAPR